jgi:hypothetical protein
MEIPIVCTLTPGDAYDRVSEWRDFLAGSVLSAAVVGDTELRLALDPLPESLLCAVDLSQRETACCSFFDFSLAISDSSCTLVIRVPPDAAPILRDFATLLPSGLMSGDA